MYSVCLIFLFLSQAYSASVHGNGNAHEKSGSSWCYNEEFDDPEECGPSHWGGDCLTGTAQSPINLVAPTEKKALYPLRMNTDYFDSYKSWFIKNNGHSVQIQLGKDPSSALSFMPEIDNSLKYVFAQMHWHWGKTEANGSEHTLYGQAFPAELHLVHYSSEYKDLGDALASSNRKALAVLGIFFTVTDNDNEELKPIINMMKKVTPYNAEYTVTEKDNSPINLSKMIPQNSPFFRYSGSLTTPTCKEAVLWTVLQKSYGISKTQLEAFRSLMDHDSKNMTHNFRPVQPLGARTVILYQSTVEKIKGSGGFLNSASPMLVFSSAYAITRGYSSWSN